MAKFWCAVLVAMAVVFGACSAAEGPVLVAGGNGATGDEAPTLQVEVESGDDVVVIDDGTAAAAPEPEPVSTTVPPPSSEPPLVIFDTDMGPDVDDVLALAMLHSYQKQGKIELAAVTISRDTVRGAKYTDAVNTFYGRGDIPIGIYRGGTVKPIDDNGTFVRLSDNWENDVADEPLLEGYRVQRQVLVEASATGREVILIQTGFSGNISALLDSQGDDISDRSGIELIEENVSLLSIMAGSIGQGIVEFNIENDISSARNLFAKWPGSLALSPFELGNAIHYPYSSITADFGWADPHPVRVAYEFRDLSWHQDAPPYYNMKAWDLTSVMFAIEPDADYFLTSPQGRVTVNGDGRTAFQPGEGQHIVLDRGAQYSSEQRQRVIDRMIELVADRP